jgi:guanylate kinase (EC 2.7.4.8)
MQQEGLLIVISAPSGAGKTTLCNGLVSRFPALKESVSYTTRQPRPGEQDGVDYHFVSIERFKQMIAENGFAEWAEVHGNFYGTAIATLEQARLTALISCLILTARVRVSSRTGVLTACLSLSCPPAWQSCGAGLNPVRLMHGR